MPDSKTALVALPRNPQNLPAPTYYLPPPHQEFEAEAPSVPLSHYLWILRRHFWRILVFVVTCVAATFVISSRLAPIYEASAVFDIDRQAPSEERRVGKERRS